jgi:tryptophan-rich sensory protein
MNSKTTRNAIYGLYSFFIVAFIALAGSFFTSKNIPTWYSSLNFPPITPPNFVFPIAWNIIFILI